MSKPDYYEVLGVPRDADADALKKAFRKQAVQYHPDRNDAPDAEERFKLVNEAYSILSDPEKRRRYDRFGHDAPGGLGGDPFQGGFDPGGLRDIFGGDLFEELFGGFFRRGAGRRHGRDVNVDLELTLEEVTQGASRTVTYQRRSPCQGCQGTGARDGTALQACQTCAGMGQVRVNRGFINLLQTCPTCEGQGREVVDPCGRCQGKGTVREEVRIDVPVPAGEATGHKLRLDGDGEVGRRGGEPGDLYVHLHITEHPFFERQDADLLCEVPVSFPQAALGARVEVPTLDGKVRVRVPAGTESGKVLRLRGKGLPRLRGHGKGDQLVRIQIETPSDLTTHQRELLEALELTLEDEGGSPRRRTFLDKLRELFD